MVDALTVKRPLHTLLIAFLAAWMPFCCCQARAAVHALVHSALDPASGAAHHCCSAAPEADECADERCADADECGEADDCAGSAACCSPGAAGADHAHKPAKAPQHGCGSCKDRVLPGGTLSLEPAGDDCQWLDFTLPLAAAWLTPVAVHVDPTHQHTGPPGLQSGRNVLQQTGLLLV